MRHEKPFPLKGEIGCKFLEEAWAKGWLDDYSDEHFVIKALECRLTMPLGFKQFINNNPNIFIDTQADGSIDLKSFCFNFCINVSCKLQIMTEVFNEKQIEQFITEQLSAGKKNYNEDTFFQALSEISILSFYARHATWKECIYEPPVESGKNKKNPEACFIGAISNLIPHSIDKDGEESIEDYRINIEVKTPAFPHDNHSMDKILIPTILLTDQGRSSIQEYCQKNNIKYLPPRVKKIVDFINSASDKFSIPGKNELNMLYINWSYRDFPSSSYLEAWSLLTNEYNGILNHPCIGMEMGVKPEAYQKISAVIVYTESLEGLMFSDFSFVWIRNKWGPYFRMWILNEDITKQELEKVSNVFFNATGMMPDPPEQLRCMLDLKSKTEEEHVQSAVIQCEIIKLIEQNIKM